MKIIGTRKKSSEYDSVIDGIQTEVLSLLVFSRRRSVRNKLTQQVIDNKKALILEKVENLQNKSLRGSQKISLMLIKADLEAIQ